MNELKKMARHILKAIRTVFSPVTTELLIASYIAYKSKVYFPALVFITMFPILVIMRSGCERLKRSLTRVYSICSALYMIAMGITLVLTFTQKTGEGMPAWPILVLLTIFPVLLTKKVFSFPVMILSTIGVICSCAGVGNSSPATQVCYLVIWAVSTTLLASPKASSK